jgi:septum formation protein
VYHPSVRLILASRSPRRAELLRAAGFEFEIIPATVDERPAPGEPPDQYVARLAALKAADVGRRISGRVILGADTEVVLDGAVLGKPADAEEAAAMLRRLAGRTHLVLTGVALRCDDREVREVTATRVRFLPLSEAEIAWYVATGEPRDKAGAYAIQGLGSRFVEWIEGSYSNVVGLPVATVYRLLRQWGAV